MNPVKIFAVVVLVSAMAGTPGRALAEEPSGEQGQPADSGQGDMMDPGNMDPGSMGPGMMGPGMMGPGMMGPGMMGPGMMDPRTMCPALTGSGMGPGMGSGYMGYHGMMGPGRTAHPGMMGPGMTGHRGGMMGPAWGYIQPTVTLSVADVKSYMERWVEATKNPRLQVGKIVEKDADTITADIVTKDDSLVQQFEVDRHSGFYHQAQ